MTVDKIIDGICRYIAGTISGEAGETTTTATMTAVTDGRILVQTAAAVPLPATIPIMKTGTGEITSLLRGTATITGGEPSNSSR